MATMTDPTSALEAFQLDLSSGHLPLKRSIFDPALFILIDYPNRRMRFTYLSIEDGQISALVMLAMVDPINAKMCFQLGVAVPAALRNQGRAKRTVQAAFAELKQAFAANNIDTYYVEAVVGTDNMPSQRVASICLSNEPTPIIDHVSGLPALHYTKKIRTTFLN